MTQNQFWNEIQARTSKEIADYGMQTVNENDLPGTSFQETTMLLAPTATFARGVLGTVGEATAEDIEQSGGTVVAKTTSTTSETRSKPGFRRSPLVVQRFGRMVWRSSMAPRTVS